MTTEEKQSGFVEVSHAAVKIGTRIIHALWAILMFAVAAAFAIGVFITQTNIHIESIGKDVAELRTLFVEDVNVRLRQVEKIIARGVLDKAERQLETHDARIRHLEENKLHPGKPR